MKLATRLANFGSAPTGTNSFTNMALSTSTTYVYSRPVTSSHPIMIYVGQQGCPNFAFRGSVSEAERPPQESREHQEDVNFRRRTNFTAFQRGELEKAFNQTQYISPRKRQSLSQELGIPKKVILTWFKNRRTKWRREHQNTGSSSAGTCVPRGLHVHSFRHVRYPNSEPMARNVRMLYESITAHEQASHPYPWGSPRVSLPRSGGTRDQH